MIPRILMLMDRDNYDNFRKLERSGACTFVPYGGLLTPQDVMLHLQQQHHNFDSVGVFSGRSDSDLRRVVEESFDGPKILFDFDESGPNPTYVRLPYPIRLDDFDRTIRTAFAEL